MVDVVLDLGVEVLWFLLSREPLWLLLTFLCDDVGYYVVLVLLIAIRLWAWGMLLFLVINY